MRAGLLAKRSPALSLEAGSGNAPLTVNSTAGKATNLNADRLDGKDSSNLEPRGYAQTISG